MSSSDTARNGTATVKKVRKQKPKPEDEARDLMRGMDLLHIKYLHVWFMGRWIDDDKYERYRNMLDDWSIDGYCECYNWLMECGEESEDVARAVISTNEYVLEFLDVWQSEAPRICKNALALMKYCAQHQFIDMTPTLKERIDADWTESGTEEDKESLYAILLPYPMEVYKMYREERYEETFANIYYLFQRLADLYRRRPDMFRYIDSCVPKMVLIRDYLQEVYFQVIGCPNVSLEIKNDIVFFIKILQDGYGYFDESSSRWYEMFDFKNNHNLGETWNWYVKQLMCKPTTSL